MQELVNRQLRLKGVWLNAIREGCPHLIKRGVDGEYSATCELNMKACSYEHEPIERCSILAEIIDEWKREGVTFLSCGRCGRALHHFAGLESIPEYFYCPQCNDLAYNEQGEVIAKLV